MKLVVPSAADQPGMATRDSLTQLVHRFYGELREDPLLGPLFDAAIGDQWDEHLQRLVEFWSTVMLGTRSFSGNVFGKHMRIEEVTPEHFQRWLTFWCAHTRALFEPQTAAILQSTAIGIARNLYRGYFDRPAGFDLIAAEFRHDFG